MLLLAFFSTVVLFSVIPTHFFYKEGFFSTQPQCCLTCSYWAQIELQILLNTYKATSFLFSSLRVRQHFFFFKIEKKNFYRLFIFILSSNVTILSSLILKQGVQGLQTFAFGILTVNDEHRKQPRFKARHRG